MEEARKISGSSTISLTSKTEAEQVGLEEQKTLLETQLEEIDLFINGKTTPKYEVLIALEQRKFLVQELRSIEDMRIAIMHQNFAIADKIKEMNDHNIADHSETITMIKDLRDSIFSLTNSSVKKCTSCLEIISKFHTMPCLHSYCIECTKKLFEMAISDTSLIPIRCCRTDIDQTIAAKVLATTQNLKFMSLLKEATTVNKMYCPNKDCSQFIDLDEIDSSSTLKASSASVRSECPNPKCAQPICVHCKTKCHKPLSCAEYQALPEHSRNPEDAAFIAICNQQGYKRCPSCQHFVELKEGCYHITCICRYEFCFNCTKIWKTCKCEIWNEANLLAAGRV